MNRESAYREVIVREPTKPEWEGYFHCWAGLSEHPIAVIETEKGYINEVPAEYIVFKL